MPTLPLPPNALRTSVLLAALVFALATTGKAAAGCGDHVVILKPAGQAQEHSGEPDSTAPKPPCHGPHCSATPSPPAAPPMTAGTVVPVTAKEVFTPTNPPAADDPSALRPAFESNSLSPIDRATSIFHPPRA